MLPIGRKSWVGRGAWPQGKSVMMLGGEHDVFRAGIVESLRPTIGIPFLNVLIKGFGKVVAIVVRSIMLAVIRLRWRAI